MQGFARAIIFEMLFSERQKRLIGRLLFLLVPYSLLRLGFYLYHRQLYVEVPSSEVLMSFVIGMRFDMAAICFVNAPMVLLSFVSNIKDKVERYLFVGINAIFLIGSCIDFELF